jgi:carbonic anhydrase/acetyltransferase-like protein (isoleucine patch superfamily)
VESPRGVGRESATVFTPRHVSGRRRLPVASCHLHYHSQMLRPHKGRYPRVHPTAFVDSSAQVIGDVEIGESSGVWMNAVLRGDVHSIRMGTRSNVQDGTIVHVMTGTHPTTIGDEVTIGHGAIVHGCTLGDRILVGMGAILLNGAVVGEDSIVAAGTLLPEGMTVPPRSLVLGSPGRVRRTLDDAEIASIREYAERYVAYRLDYMQA